MKKTTKTLTTIGTAIASTFAVNAVHAESNPFAINDLNSGYMQLAQSDKAGEMKCGSKMKMEKKTEASCGEGKCGAMMDGDKMKKGLENSCGAMMKGKEGACGDMKAKSAAKQKVSKSGWGHKKANNAMQGMKMEKGKSMEGKCGEGMCGGMMEKGMKMKKGMESSCGAMMKGKEGACGMGSMGDMKGMQGMSGMKGIEGGCGSSVTKKEAAGK